jgi:hypothetical protein
LTALAAEPDIDLMLLDIMTARHKRRGKCAGQTHDNRTAFQARFLTGSRSPKHLNSSSFRLAVCHAANLGDASRERFWDPARTRIRLRA